MLDRFYSKAYEGAGYGDGYFYANGRVRYMQVVSYLRPALR